MGLESSSLWSGSATALSISSRVSWPVWIGSRPLIPWAASPSAMAFTSSGCSLQNSATWSNDRAVFSTSQTAVALGINGASCMDKSPPAPRPPFRTRPVSSKMTGIWPEYRHLTPGSPMPRRQRLTGPGQEPHFSPMNAENTEKPPAEGPALLAARLLRRRGPGDRFGRAGAQALRRTGLCPPRDRPQPLRGGKPEGQGRGFRRGTRRNPRHRRAGDLLRPRRAEVDPGGIAAPELLPSRRHLPAGDQGAPRGRNPPQARPQHPPDRPCRASRGGRHARPVAGRRDHAGADRRGGRGA